MKAVFVFSGQGAQKVGMGKDLYDSDSTAKAVFDEADGVLDEPISKICFEGPAEKLTESKYCQPAIFTVSTALYKAFTARYPDILPVGCAGLSLGEYSALCAAGVFSFGDGLKIIAKRGELMDKACRETAGGMASVLGVEADVVREICSENDIDVANYNCPGQIVVSGESGKVKNAVKAFKEKGYRKVIPLKVAGAYHSRLMENAGRELGDYLSGTSLQSPAIPVAQNVTGKVENNPEQIRENLVEQVAGSVRWQECMEIFIKQNADTVIEFGPGNVLTGLAKRINRDLNLFNINSMDNLEAFKSV